MSLAYFMTGRAIQGNIQFEGGSIGPTQGGTIHNLRTEYCLTKKECNKDLLYDSNLVGIHRRGGEKEKEKERRTRVAGEARTRALSFVKMAL